MRPRLRHLCMKYPIFVLQTLLEYTSVLQDYGIILNIVWIFLRLDVYWHKCLTNYMIIRTLHILSQLILMRKQDFLDITLWVCISGEWQNGYMKTKQIVKENYILSHVMVTSRCWHIIKLTMKIALRILIIFMRQGKRCSLCVG